MSERKTIILCAGQNGRAVVIGKVDSDPIPGEPVTLYEARMLLYWSAECGGLFGFVANGPKGDTRLTATVPKIVETQWQEWGDIPADSAKSIYEWPAE